MGMIKKIFMCRKAYFVFTYLTLKKFSRFLHDLLSQGIHRIMSYVLVITFLIKEVSLRWLIVVLALKPHDEDGSLFFRN